MERSDELATKYAPTVTGIQQVGGARARQAGPLDRQVETRPTMAVWTAEDRKTTIPTHVIIVLVVLCFFKSAKLLGAPRTFGPLDFVQPS